jgi:carbon storage regulator
MLVLSRKENERIKLGDSITVTVVRVTGDKVRLGIEAPANVLVLREELEQTTYIETQPPAYSETKPSADNETKPSGADPVPLSVEACTPAPIEKCTPAVALS